MIKSIFFTRHFWPIFWTQFFGAFNDNVFKNALIILITYQAMSLAGLSSSIMVSLCGGLFILPFFLLSGIAGELSDKYSKNILIKKIKIAEIIIMCAGALGFATESLTILLFTLFCMGAQSTFFGPIKYSILPELLDEKDLVSGNAFVESGTFMAILIGTITGGILISFEGHGKWLISISVIVFAIIGYVFSIFIEQTSKEHIQHKVDFNFIRSSFKIIKLTMKEKKLMTAIYLISWFWFVGAVLLSLFPLYVKNILKGDQLMVTFFLGLFSVGVGIGSILCERMSHGKIKHEFVLISSLLMTFFMIDLSLISYDTFQTSLTLDMALKSMKFMRILFDFLFISILGGFFTVPLYTFLQRESSQEIRSRVIAGLNIYNSLFMVSSAIGLMYLFSLNMKSSEIYIILGVFHFIVCLTIYLRSTLYKNYLKKLIRRS